MAQVGLTGRCAYGGHYPSLADPLRASNALRPKGARLPLWAIDASLSRQSLRTCGALSSLGSFWSLETNLTPQATRALWTLGTQRTNQTGRSLWTLRANVTLLTTLSDESLRTGWTLGPVRPLGTNVALLTTLSDGSLRTDWSLDSLITFRSTGVALDSLRTLRPFRS